MPVATHEPLSIRCGRRLADLPRNAQFLLLTLRLARELSVNDRHFQGFVYTLCGISRVERALKAVEEILQCFDRASRILNIESTSTDLLAEDERRLLALLRSRRDAGRMVAREMFPYPVGENLIRAMNRLANALE